MTRTNASLACTWRAQRYFFRSGNSSSSCEESQIYQFLFYVNKKTSKNRREPEPAFWTAVMNLDEFRLRPTLLESMTPATGCCCGVGSLNHPDVIRRQLIWPFDETFFLTLEVWTEEFWSDKNERQQFFRVVIPVLTSHAFCETHGSGVFHPFQRVASAYGATM